MVHAVGDPGHVSAHNSLDTLVAGKLDSSAAAGTYAPQSGVNYGTKRAGYVCSTPSGTTAVATEAVMRYPVRVPVTTTRWRLHIRNWQPNAGTATSGAVNFNGAWIGVQDHNPNGTYTGYGFGKFTATPTQALASFSTPADGSEYVSGWVTDPALQFTKYTDQLLSLGFTTSAASVATSTGASCFISTGAGVAANANVASYGPSNTSKTGYFDFWIEYEFVGNQPVGIVFGDSITAGQTTTAGVLGAEQGTTTDRSWPHQYALYAGAPMVNAGLAGLSTGGVLTGTNGFYSRFGIGTNFTPDFAIIALGSNDVLGRQTSTSVEANLLTIAGIVQGLGISRIFIATVLPRNFTHGTVSATAASGVTSLSTSVAFANGDVVYVGYGTANRESLTVSGASTGTGPYTTTFTGATTKAHNSGELVFKDQEAFRRDLNVWARMTPYPFHGAVDFDRVMADTTDPATVISTLVDPDGTHLLPQGYQRMATSVPSKLVGL